MRACTMPSKIGVMGGSLAASLLGAGVMALAVRGDRMT